MIASLRGTVLVKRPDILIIEVSGVGYQVGVPVVTLAELPDEGQDVFLYIYTHVREDSLQLFGFMREEEKRFFVSLLSVSGIGPKVALNILSGGPYKDLVTALEASDIAFLTKIPGLGKKTAQRIIMELKGKLPVEEETAKDRTYTDALSAMINLGYKKPMAAEALDMAYKKGISNLEGLIKESLRLLTAGMNDEKH